jgi:hypothetical protein
MGGFEPTNTRKKSTSCGFEPTLFTKHNKSGVRTHEHRKQLQDGGVRTHEHKEKKVQAVGFEPRHTKTKKRFYRDLNPDYKDQNLGC